jgi:signal transduction histidine kinase
VTAKFAALGGVTAGRPASGRRTSASPPLPRWVERLLALPLAGKLAGASTLVVVAAVAAMLVVHVDIPHNGQTLLITAAALITSLAVKIALVCIALRPLHELEATAERVSRHELDARVPPSLLADRDMARVGRTFNRVLDDLIADRARMRRLASEVIREGDRQRALVSRELYDSAAQALAALMFEVTAAARDSRDPALAERLEHIHAFAVEVLDEVRLLAQRVHPRILDDLGLGVALDRLARNVRETTGVRVEVEGTSDVAHVPPSAATPLYRVAEEAVSNALRHGSPRSVGIRLERDEFAVRLQVTDDGDGFDPAAPPSGQPGVGVFTMRQRVALAGGIFEIDSRPGGGTVVSATIPFGSADNLDAG